MEEGTIGREIKLDKHYDAPLSTLSIYVLSICTRVECTYIENLARPVSLINVNSIKEKIKER